ncbi:MAG: oligosaccharide flippase family protein, partial [Bacteroidales bacterium]
MGKSVIRKVLDGVFYIAIGKYTGFVLSLVIAGVLSRILNPSDFGVMSLATICIAFFTIFCDPGIGTAIIQNKNLTEKNYSELFSFSFIIGIAISGCLFLFSILYGTFYNSAELVKLCRVMALSLFFNALNTIPNGLLYKEKMFRFLAIRNVVIQLIGGAIAVLAAYKGIGVYALTIQPIFTAIASFSVCYLRKPIRPAIHFSNHTFTEIFSYSGFQFLFNIINFFSRNVDNLLVGKYLGVKPLGFYDKSYRLVMLPLE